MSLNKEMLATIQKAGAAVFDADAQLRLAVKAYGERVHAAVGSNPYHLGNDALFENWKLVARLSQTMTGMEEELRKVHQVASELNDDESSTVTAMPALPAPALSSPPAGVARIDQKATLAATDVKIKKTNKTPKAKTAPALKSTPTLPKNSSGKAALLPKNAVMLLKHLGTVLNVKDFTEFNQTKASQATGIPLGSMTASLKRLMADGHLVAGPNGQYMLAK